MRTRWTNTVLFLAITSWMAIACTAGSGGLASFEDPYDRPPDSRDKPGDSRDRPTLSGRDNPPGTIENPGTYGGGSNGCPPCDGTFACTSTLENQTSNQRIVLKSIGGTCFAIDDKGKAQGGLTCGGTIIDDDGKSEGTWQGTGPNSFTVTGIAKVSVTSNGQTTTTTTPVTTTCTRESDSTTPIPKPTSTGTGTSNPPPPTIVDAGIRDSSTSFPDSGIRDSATGG